MSVLTIAEAAGLIAAKKLSPVELAKAHLDRIRRLDAKLNAFLLLTEERALADAKAAEARQMSGTLRGPLDGIPIAHKDIYNTAGIRTTAHSKLLKDNVPTRDAHTVKKWADAGTVMLGKLATHEFAFGGPAFDLPWPPARNPWNTDHFTAGSSSGTGAAVAAGLILGGTGSDTGGSIRGPAALCGIAGIKPTYGLSSRSGILPLAYSLDHAGPMAWTAQDCALLLQGMAGHDPEDPASVDRPVANFTADLGMGAKGLRIGVVRHFFETDNRASDATRAGIDAAMDFFRKEGAQVRDITLSPMADYFAVGWLLMVTEAFALHGPWLRERFMDYSEMFRDRVALAAMLSGPDIVQATRRRRVLCKEMAEAMADLDIIVMASAVGEAPRLDNVPKWSGIEKPSFTMPCNVTGFPAISICTGFGTGGLPVAMQLAAKPFHEPTLFRAAHAYEMAMPWRAKRPAMAA
jgi:aspartyl-tRNA(Asn)/glutamyl-tRNA(Gln) amidotransferase subunit A